MSGPRYIALIGDLVATRDLKPEARGQLQTRLGRHFAAVKAEARAGFAAWPLVTIGDEFQALFPAHAEGCRALLTLIPELLNLASPTAMRFGLGLGTLGTELREEALGMDGPCFHRARAALERARALDLPCQLDTEQGDAILWSTLASYALRQRMGWTPAQAEAIARFEGGRSWKQVAEALRITPSAVSLRQKAAGWSLYERASSALEKGLLELIS
ncbi:hypothetical protein FJ251_14205 [bacterium]|nr:hypothetical protein [bacterium]